MTNMILLVAVVTLLIILLALFVIVFMEFTARKSFEHYSMDLIKEKQNSNSEEERTIPVPIKKGNHSNNSIKKKEQTLHNINEKNIEWEINRVLEKDYGHFNHQRLIDNMGLSSNEADEFVLELIKQLEVAVKELEKYTEEQNFNAISKLTHELKGAALNIGTGGVADILIDYNNEFKNSKNIELAKAYLKRVKEAISNLKIEYSRVA